MIHIARSSALIDFIKNICYNLYIKQKIKKLGTSIEAGPRHLSCNKTRAHKKERAATAVLFFIALMLINKV